MVSTAVHAARLHVPGNEPLPVSAIALPVPPLPGVCWHWASYQATIAVYLCSP